MRERRGGRRLTGLLALAALLVVVVTAVGIFPFRQIIADRRSVTLAQEQLLALRAENEHLEGQVAVLQTDEEVERLAREQFGLVRPGEIAYVVVSPQGEEETVHHRGGAHPGGSGRAALVAGLVELPDRGRPGPPWMTMP